MVERSVNLVKKLLSAAIVTAFLITLCGYTPADAFREKGMIYLAQQTEQSADEKSEAPPGEDSDDAEPD